jgi:hypothetical protein
MMLVVESELRKAEVDCSRKGIYRSRVLRRKPLLKTADSMPTDWRSPVDWHLSIQMPNSFSVVPSLIWKRMIGQQLAVQSFGSPQSLQ